MKSELPKVLHTISGRPMIEYVLDAARDAGATRLVVIVGHQAQRVESALAHHDDIEFALQAEQKGTGHAVMMCDSVLESHDGPVLVLAGDTPLLKGPSLATLVDLQNERNAACVIGSAITENNFGLGRIVRDPSGEFLRIVEQKDANEQEAAITEINTGCYTFDCQRLRSSLQQIKPNNSQAEYYLTDCPAVLKSEGHVVAASPSLDINEAMGVNTRAQLADIEAVLQARHARVLMDSGVSIISPVNTYIDLRATIGRETVIHPFTSIHGPIRIGEGCEVGPHAAISSDLADKTVVGPFETR